MSRRRLAAIVAGVVILAAVILPLVLAASRRAAETAVVTTASSDGSAVPPAATATSRLAAPARAANRIDSTPGPAAAGLEQTVVSAVTKPLLVLSPRVVHQGAGIGVWGSGFPGGVAVDIFLKQNMSDIVDPVTFVQTDQNGQFGEVRVAVPDSVSLGTLMIQAMERQGSLTATAAATVTGADDPQVGTQVRTATTILTAGTTATPTAAAMVSLTAVATASPTTVATPSPTVVVNVGSRPTATPESEPTDSPRHTQQPTSTAQPEPTEQRPQPTASPQPTPADQSQRPQPTASPQPRRPEQSQASPETSRTSPGPSSYTVQPGDSLSVIAERVYGSADDWKALYDANRAAIGANPNLIHPGTELDIPPEN